MNHEVTSTREYRVLNLKLQLKQAATKARALRAEERKRKRPSDKPFKLKYGENYLEPYTEALRRWRENTARQEMREYLYWERTHLLRSATRAAHIAYAFLRGKPCPEHPNSKTNRGVWQRAAMTVFIHNGDMKAFREWCPEKVSDCTLDFEVEARVQIPVKEQ